MKLQYDEPSNTFRHIDVNETTGEITPHRFGHRTGSKIREVYKKDKITRKLVKVDQYDIDKYIGSFKQETNVKDLVEKLRAKGVTPEEYLKRNGGFFGDISEAPGNVLEAIIMANTWEDKVDEYERWKATQVAPTPEPEPTPEVK